MTSYIPYSTELALIEWRWYTSHHMNNKPKTLLNCLECGKEFQTYPYAIKRGDGKYCSRECSCKNNETKIKIGQRLSTKTEFKKGETPWNKDKKGYETSLRGRSRPDMKKDKNGQWKGDDVGYFGLHVWIAENCGRAKKCDACGSDDPDKKYHWANLDSKYSRDINSWKRMCVSCHSKYDKSWLKRNRDQTGRFS